MTRTLAKFAFGASALVLLSGCIIISAEREPEFTAEVDTPETVASEAAPAPAPAKR